MFQNALLFGFSSKNYKNSARMKDSYRVQIVSFQLGPENWCRVIYACNVCKSRGPWLGGPIIIGCLTKKFNNYEL